MYAVHSLDVGGTEKLIYDIAEALPKYDIEPMVCCLDSLGVWGERLKSAGTKVYNLQRRAGIDTLLVKRLRGLIKEESPDILNPHQYTPYFYSVISAALLSKRPKVVFTEHGRFYPDTMKWKRVIFNQVANIFTDEIVGVSEFSKKALVDVERFPEKRIKVIYNGIKTESFSRTVDVTAIKKSLGLVADDVIIGTVGRLCAEKNHRMLIRAFADVRKAIENAKLLIVGGGELENELKAFSRDLGINSDVIFLGQRQDVPELLKIFDVFALSSDSEGASLVLLEAMASALPVVATAVGGSPELILSGKTGLLVPRGDHKAFSEAILYVLRNPAIKKEMGMTARAHFDSEFTFDAMIKKYVDLYNAVSADKLKRGDTEWEKTGSFRS
jgi:glycosyltransferase involved in cell wall biosynthesis